MIPSLPRPLLPSVDVRAQVTPPSGRGRSALPLLGDTTAIASGVFPGETITDSYRMVFHIGAGLLTLGAVLSWWLLRNSSLNAEDAEVTSALSGQAPPEGAG